MGISESVQDIVERLDESGVAVKSVFCSRMFEWKKADVKDGLSTRARGGEWICSWCHAGEGVLRRQC